MFRKSVFLFLALTGVVSFCIAQEPAERCSIGTKEIVHSKILNEDRNVYIFLPEGYSSSNENYLVLYTLYSVAPDFHFNTGVVAGLNRYRLIPKMITVAVDLGDSRRDLTPTESDDYGPTSGGAGNFLEFMKEELIPFIDGKYRTSSQRVYWSHSIGGLFGLYALLLEPDLFHSVLVSSPWMIYDRGQRYILKNTENFLRKRNKQNNFLYICVGNEPDLIPEIEEFLGILEKNKPESLTWKYVKMPEEDHMSILARSLIEGLRALGSK